LRLSDGEQQAFDRGLVYEARMRGELHSNESSPFSVETSRRLMVDQAAFFLTRSSLRSIFSSLLMASCSFGR
jgi:hypothetical protein